MSCDFDGASEGPAIQAETGLIYRSAYGDREREPLEEPGQDVAIVHGIL